MTHIMRDRTRWLSVVPLLVAAGTGCAADATATTPDEVELARPGAPAADDAADDAAHAAHAIRFAPCVEDPELECGELSVPLDHGRPRGERISLAVVRAPALTPHRQGAIFVNPGGPGGSGVDFVIRAKSLFAPLRQRFDVVSFDPRGTARSRAVECTLELPSPPASDTPEALAAFLDESGARYVRACAEQHGALATRIGTNHVARDIDVFRAALGERELNYLGFSYGTILGASYATQFPHRVRAMVLDANVTPAWLSDYLLELDTDGSAGAEATLRRLDQLCRATADCPLRDTGVVAVYDRVVARLDRAPVVVGDGVITGASVTNLVFPLLYNERLGWPAIIGVLASADAGDYAALPPLPAEPSPFLTLPSTFAILCNDSTTRRLALDYLPAQTAGRASFPRFGGVNLGLEITACSTWPRTRVTPLANLETRHPVVLIGNDFDPATPMAWTRNMATALGAKAALVRYQGGGHTIYGSGSACIDGAVEAYFRDLTAPPSGLTCPALPLGASIRERVAGTARMADILPQVMPKNATLPRR
jgi:pimeloyl-ACP methyl ester carboxylesterase